MNLFVAWAPFISCTLAGLCMGLLLYDRLSERAAEILYHVSFLVGFGLWLFGLILKRGLI